MSTITANVEQANTYRSLKDKVVLITGASTGIGRAIAIETARQGANVVVNYIGKADAAQEVVREIENDHGAALAIEADVSKSEQVEHMISQAVSQLGRVDVLVNNAGIEKESPFLDKPESEFDAVIGVNLKGPFLCTQAAATRRHIHLYRNRWKSVASLGTHLNLRTFQASTGVQKVMSRRVHVYFLGLAAICASTVLASAQVTSPQTEIQNSSIAPVAFVYVANSPTSKTNQITGYSARLDGTLTPIAGSPFHFNVTYMALTGHWLFGIANTFEDVDSFAISSNGALSLKDKLTVVTNGDGLLADYLDHTGSTLYADLYTTNNDFLSYTIDHSTGQIMQIGDLPGGPSDGGAVSFIGNDVFAYSSSCYHFSPEIVGVRRNSNGSLAYLDSFNPPFPTEKSGGFYCPFMAAADPTNHLAIALQPLTSYWTADGAWQLASYTVNATGNLSTNSTYTNMPKVMVGLVRNYWMSPSGKLLAVGGSSGLQVFHFNGANPITKYTGLLTTSPIDQVLWDNASHLYAISRSASKLYVFTVTLTSVTQAPGSPHSITQPQNLIVLPRS